MPELVETTTQQVDPLLVGLLIVVPLAASLVFWIVATRAKFQNRLFLLRTEPLPGPSLTLFFAGGVVLLLNSLVLPLLTLKIAGTRPAEFDPAYQQSVTQVVLALESILIVAVLGFVAMLPSGVPRLSGFRKDDFAGQFRNGGLGFLAALLPVFVVLLAVLPLKSDENQHPLLKLIQQGASTQSIVEVCLLAIVVAPIVEELIYRVLLQQGLIVLGYKPQVVIPGVAIFFCLNHQFPDSLPLFPLALLLGVIYYRRNSVLSSIAIHMLFNGYNILLALAFPPA